MTVNNSTVTGNKGEAGGIFNASGRLTVNNSTVTGNQGGDFGGGISNQGGTVTVNNSTVIGNTTVAGVIRAGGGIVNAGGDPHFPAKLTVNNSTVSDNTAGDEGGGIFNTSATLTLNNSKVTGNTANDGGGIWTDNGGTLTNSTVIGNIPQPCRHRRQLPARCDDPQKQQGAAQPAATAPFLRAGQERRGGDTSAPAPPAAPTPRVLDRAISSTPGRRPRPGSRDPPTWKRHPSVGRVCPASRRSRISRQIRSRTRSEHRQRPSSRWEAYLADSASSFRNVGRRCLVRSPSASSSGLKAQLRLRPSRH